MTIVGSSRMGSAEGLDEARPARDGVRETVSRLSRNWWQVALSALVGGVALLAYSLVLTPLFSSTATLYVTSGTDANAQSAYQGSLASQQRVVSYTQLATSESVVAKAVTDGEVDLTVDEARNALTASSRPETVLLSVSAKNSDPDVAASLANAVAASLSSYVATLEEPSGGGDALARLTIVSRAVPSDSPVEPQIARNTVGGVLAGLFLGVGLVVLRSRFDNRIFKAEDISETSRCPVLAEVPENLDVTNLSASTVDGGASPSSESYRRLRTNLSFINVDDPARRIVVTSANESEGKTTTSVNLALVLAESGKRVLIVDADLRRPRVAQMFGLNPAVGLTDCLRDATDVSNVVQQTAFESLDLLASGSLPPNPSELLGSQKAARLFEFLGSQYDCIVVDTPPVMPLSDAAVTSQWCDGILIVVRAGQTRRPDFEATVESLGRSSADVLGVVLNGSVKANKRYGHYYYGQ